MEEEIKAIRTIKEFVAWYDENKDNVVSASVGLKLNEFYRKFSYILKQDEEENIMMGKLLG
jgi:predicted phosphoadenosine phosphosulfate sulfurtransferase